MKMTDDQFAGIPSFVHGKRPKQREIPFPGLSKEVLEAAQKAVLACKKTLPQIAREQVLIDPAALQKAHERGTLQISSADNRWVLQLERKEQWLAHFSCKHNEIERYAGRYLEMNIDDRVYLLGNIDAQGMATGKIADLTGSPVIIHIGPKMKRTGKQQDHQQQENLMEA